MRKPRYEVHSITGFRISPSAYETGGAARPYTTYTVLDSVYCFREVASFSPSRNGRPPARVREQRAADLCARLNAEDRADAA